MFKNTHSPRVSRRLRVESLEDRRLMANDITAQLANGSLNIQESGVVSGGASDISITRLANGYIRVSANPASGGKVNGQAFVDFAAKSPNLSVNLGDGADKLRIENVSFNKVDINMGKTNSIVGDNDDLTINGLTTRGSLKITTADGNDKVNILRSTIGNGLLDQGESEADILSILGGKGSDSVSIGDLTNLSTINGTLHINTTSDRLTAIDGTPNQTELGDDSVAITNVNVTDDLMAWLGGGTNTLDMVGVSVGDYISMYGGGGQDVARLRDVNARNAFYARMGAGNDTLGLDNVRTQAPNSIMYLDGGIGTDKLIRNNSGAPTVQMGQWE